MEPLDEDMAPEDEMEEDTEDTREGLTDQEEQDLHIAWLIAENMLEKGGIDVVLEAQNSSGNPAQVIGQFIAQLIMQIHEGLTDDLALSPRIYFSENGLVEMIGDYLEDEGVDTEIVDDAEVTALSIMQSVAQGNSQRTQPAQQGGALGG